MECWYDVSSRFTGTTPGHQHYIQPALHRSFYFCTTIFLLLVCLSDTMLKYCPPLLLGLGGFDCIYT